MTPDDTQRSLQLDVFFVLSRLNIVVGHRAWTDVLPLLRIKGTDWWWIRAIVLAFLRIEGANGWSLRSLVGQ